MITFLIGMATGAAATVAFTYLMFLRECKLEREAEQRRKIHDLYSVTHLESQTRRGFGRHS